MMALVLASCSGLASFRDQMLAVTRDVTPEVRGIMGTERAFTVRVTRKSFAGRRMAITTPDRACVIYGREIEELPEYGQYFVAAHEVVHIHVDGYWRTMPVWLEEAFAYLVALELVPAAESGKQDYLDESFPSDRRAFEVASALGIEGVRDLARRAHGEGLGEIPEDWFEAVGGAPHGSSGSGSVPDR